MNGYVLCADYCLHVSQQTIYLYIIRYGVKTKNEKRKKKGAYLCPGNLFRRHIQYHTGNIII